MYSPEIDYPILVFHVRKIIVREFKKKILYPDIDLKKICLRTNFDSVVSFFSKSDYNKVAVHAMHLTPKKYNFLPLFYCKRKRKKEISECDMFSDVSCQSLPISYDEFFRVALTRRLFCFQMFFFFTILFLKNLKSGKYQLSWHTQTLMQLVFYIT